MKPEELTRQITELVDRSIRDVPGEREAYDIAIESLSEALEQYQGLRSDL